MTCGTPLQCLLGEIEVLNRSINWLCQALAPISLLPILYLKFIAADVNNQPFFLLKVLEDGCLRSIALREEYLKPFPWKQMINVK